MHVYVCSFPCKLWPRILLLVLSNKMFSKEILSLFWSWVFKWQIYVTSEYTVNTQFREYIVLALIQKQAYFWVQKIDNVEMVIYKPASFVSK